MIQLLKHKQIKHSDVNKHFKEIVIKDNAEGLIIRNDSVVYKIKKEETADLLITGYTLGSRPNQIRSISLGVFLNENDVIRHPLVKKIIKAYKE